MGQVDPRLTGFVWDERRCAPVERLIDPHTHYRGKKADLECLSTHMEKHHVECAFLICGAYENIDDIEEFGKIGERFVPTTSST